MPLPCHTEKRKGSPAGPSHLGFSEPLSSCHLPHKHAPVLSAFPCSFPRAAQPAALLQQPPSPAASAHTRAQDGSAAKSGSGQPPAPCVALRSPDQTRGQDRGPSPPTH